MQDSFRSFVDYGGFEQKPPGNPDVDLRLLPDEIVSSQCDDCALYLQFGDNFLGRVYCTNIRLCFVPLTTVKSASSLPRRSLIFDDVLDIPLVSIHKVYYSLSDTTNGFDGSIVERRKFKPLTTSVSSMDIISSLKLYLKDMRVVTFDLSKSQNAANIANHTLHFSRPSSAQNIVQLGSVKNMYRKILFNDASDWDVELSRCGQKESGMWRVLSPRKDGLSMRSVTGYPMHVVVPRDLVKYEIEQIIPNCKLGRFPVWMWSPMNGASLLRSAYFEDTLNGKALQEKVCHLVALCSPERDNPHLLIVPPEMGPQKIATSFEKLRKMCALDSHAQVEAMDQDWLSRLYDSRWPKLVTYCLRSANEVIAMLVDAKRSVIVFEDEGRDFSAVISALVQVCVDPYCRYIDGLLFLIAKEFSAMGHPFGERTLDMDDKSGEGESETTPTLLVFLDCVHQLIELYPMQFNYSQHLLIAIWDLSLTGLVPSFTCSSVTDQLAFGRTGGPQPLTAFLTEEYMALFSNVVNDAAQAVAAMKPNYSSKLVLPGMRAQSGLLAETIRPPTTQIDFRFWNECFLRWMPTANVTGGGEQLFTRELDNTMDILVRRQNRATVTWTRQYGPSGEGEELSSAFPYSPCDSTHQSTLNRTIRDTSDTVSVSGMSITGKTKPLDDSRSLRSKFSFKLKGRSKTPKYNPEDMLP